MRARRCAAYYNRPMPRPYLIAGLICALVNTPALARTVYKCTTPQGTPTYQDAPCAKGQQETALQFDTPPAPPPEPAMVQESPPAAPAADAPKPAPAAPPPPQPRLRKPLTPMWVCTRPEDGTSYFNTSGVTTSRLVPLAMLNIPGKSLAQVYGPGGGGGVSAPELSKPPTSPATGRNAIANDYTEVRDDCVPASPDQTCSYLRTELDSVEKKLRNAFKDDRAVLEPRRYELRDQLDACD
jgi:hypothetical protein